MSIPSPTSEQPYGPGAICEDCGHFAERHDESGCHFPRPAGQIPCACPSMRWQGVRWSRPWLPAPEGLAGEAATWEVGCVGTPCMAAQSECSCGGRGTCCHCTDHTAPNAAEVDSRA